jgi:hypothetical protein
LQRQAVGDRALFLPGEGVVKIVLLGERPVNILVAEGTLRDVEGLGWSSRITSSAKRESFAFKCRVNGISVRTLTRGRSAAF